MDTAVMRAPLLFAPLLVAGVGCGENVVGELPAEFLRDGGPPAPRDGGPEELAYPDGPYGTDVGDVIMNTQFAGYLVAAPTPDVTAGGYLTSVTFEDLRNLEGYDYLLFNVAADWCAECKLEAAVFPRQYEDWAPRGGLLVSVVIEDINTLPATKPILDNWVGSQAPNYTTLHDPSGFVNREIAPATLPLNMVIDLESMTILRSQIGGDPAVFDFFEAKLDP